MHQRIPWRRARIVFLFCAATGMLAAQTLVTLVNFTGINGASPNYGALIQATDGLLYGTTSHGGASGNGTICKLTTHGTLTTIYNFCAQANCTDGESPNAGLVQAANENFYGTTVLGGYADRGTIYQLTLGGTLTTLHSFSGSDGMFPYAGLIQGADGDLYGTTEGGGANGYGTVFKIAPGGVLTTLHSFDGADGGHTYAGLIQTNDGYLYGTTSEGGTNGVGTVFSIAPNGEFTTLHNFTGTDGANPTAALVQAKDGFLYGTTSSGGPGGNPCACYGTVFQMTPAGVLTVLTGFDKAGGTTPYAALIQATDGNLYGTAFGIPAFPPATGIDGTIFKVAPNSPVTVVYNFGYSPYTGDPEAALLQATDGNFYGTTLYGGTDQVDGTVFSLSTGLGPFVKTLPTAGAVGATIRILGTDLTGASSVNFNGVGATFSVVQPSEIVAVVPAGATTGTVQVTTPGGTLLSNPTFFVRQ